VQPGQLALDVEESDFAEIERLGIELVPGVHVATHDVVRQVVDIVEAHARRGRICRAEPAIVVRIGRALGAVAIHEIEQRAADADHGRNIERLVVARVLGRAEIECALERMPRVDHAPRHGGRAGPVLGDEARGVRGRIAIEHVVDAALAIERDVLGAVPGDLDIAHLAKQDAEFLRLGMRELDELEAVGAGGIVRADGCGRRVVRKWAHGMPRELARASVTRGASTKLAKRGCQRHDLHNSGKYRSRCAGIVHGCF
jgi:hypothetical protein